MSDNRQNMEKKMNMPAPKSLQSNNKTESKKQSDSNSKHLTNRRNGKNISLQSQRIEVNRNVGFKKNSNNCKQPQPRIGLFCRKKSSEVTDSLNDVEDDDILPSLKQREHNKTWNTSTKYGFRKRELPQKFSIKHFLIANCQFVVKSGKDYSQWMFDQDEIVNWDSIEQIKMFSTQFIKCPICMDIPITPKMTRCGHIYCWPCILRYLDINKEINISCPICHTTILKKELQSVEIIIKEECCVNQPITLQLMKRDRNSLQVYPISELREYVNKPPDNIPLSISEPNFSILYSRLLIGDKNQILNILNKEREALVLLLDYWETEDVEKKYIFEALELLSNREDLLLNKELNFEVKQINCEKINSTSNMSSGSSPLSCFKNIFDAPGCSKNLDKNLTVCNSEIKNIDNNLNDLSSVDVQEALHKNPIKKDFYFYQAIDGQHIYLSAINVEMLESMFGSLENSPQQINATVIEKQYLSMTETLRKRYRFLLHLPITTVFEWVELDLSNIVNHETLFIFKSNLDERKAKRDRRARDEQRLAKRFEERNYKKQLPPPEWNNREIFPECGYDPFADKSMIPLSEAIGTTPIQEHTVSINSNGSPNSLSFSKALQNENTSNNFKSNETIINVPSQWPILGSRPNSMSMNNILEDAVANMNLNGEREHNKSKSKKKKRSKYEPIF